MATFLRSIKFVRRINLQSRRLSSLSATHIASNAQLFNLSRIEFNCPFLHENRTYVTQSKFQTKVFHSHNNIDQLLDELDHKVRNYQGIYKKHIDAVLNAVTEKGSLNSTQALLMIRCCGEFLAGEPLQIRNELINQIWETIKELEVPLDVSHYNALLLVYLDNERDFSPVDILMEMKTSQIQPNHVTFQRLIKHYCNKGDIPGATKILEHMSKTEIPINENIFNSLIKGHSEAGDMPNAIKILSIMKNASIELSSRTYIELLCAYAKRGDIESIKSTFVMCKEKNIQLADKEILDIIYTLAVNQHLDMTDEMITYLKRGGLYNKDAVLYINKLIDKNSIDVAYKLLKTLVRQENIENIRSGGFFLRKLIMCKKSPETIIKYCNLLKEDGQHSDAYELAIIYMFTHNQSHLALPVMKCWAETGAEIREHFFYPIFVAHSKDNNLQGLLNTAKTMVFDFKITPSISTIKEYIVPFLIEDPQTNARTLVNNHLPYGNVANAILLHLLNRSKTQQAHDFVLSTGITYQLSMLARPLARALSYTGDIDSIAGIVHHQYIMANKNEQAMEQQIEERFAPREFSSSVVAKVTAELPEYNTTLLTNFLESLYEKGVGINEKGVEQVKNKLGDKITTEIESFLSALVSYDLNPQTIKQFNNGRSRYNRKSNTAPEGSPEFTMQLVQQHAQNGEHEEVNKLLEQLEQENSSYNANFCATMLEYFSKTENIKKASEWFNKLKEKFADFKIDKTKLLRYANALVKRNRIEEALQILKLQAYDLETNRDILIDKLLNSVRSVCPEKLEEFIELIVAQKYTTFVTSTMLRPLVRTPLQMGDVEKAVEKYKWACEKYKVAPCKGLLMQHLINKEDAKTLKHVTDLSTLVHGERNSLIDLAVAFFETNRPHQAKKILQTPGLRLSRDKIRMVVEGYYKYNDKRLESFIELINDLFLDMDSFYVLLLKSYGRKGEWKKCLALWTQLQEDNIQPSAAFMEELEEILKEFNQKIPFATSIKASTIDTQFDTALLDQNLEEAEKILSKMPSTENGKRSRQFMKLAEAILTFNNNLEKSLSYFLTATDQDPAVIESHSQFIENILVRLVQADRFELITKLFSKLTSQKKQNIPYNKILNKCYLEQGKYQEFLSHFEKVPDGSNSLINSMFHISFNASTLLQHPEYLEKMKNVALKAVDCKNYRLMNVLWTWYFFKDDPQADVIFNTYLKNGKYFLPISSLIVCQENGAWNKLPRLVEKVVTSEMELLKKRKTIFAILRKIMTSDEPNRYETAYECLRHITKIVPLHQIKSSYMTELRNHLPDNLSLDSINIESDRVKTEAAG